MGFFDIFWILKLYTAVDASLNLDLDTENESSHQGLQNIKKLEWSENVHI